MSSWHSDATTAIVSASSSGDGQRNAHGRCPEGCVPGNRLCAAHRQRRNNRLISLIMAACNSTSAAARRFRSRSRRRIRASESTRHCCSACSSAASSTSRPCRSYRLHVRLHRTTARRQTAGLFRPPGTRGLAQRQEDQMVHVGAGQAQRTCVVHDGRSPVPLHSAQVQSHRLDDDQVGR